MNAARRRLGVWRRWLHAAVALTLLGTALPGTAVAHEVRPGYLELREIAAGRFQVLWKKPALAMLIRCGFYLQFDQSRSYLISSLCLHEFAILDELIEHET